MSSFQTPLPLNTSFSPRKQLPVPRFVNNTSFTNTQHNTSSFLPSPQYIPSSLENIMRKKNITPPSPRSLCKEESEGLDGLLSLANLIIFSENNVKSDLPTLQNAPLSTSRFFGSRTLPPLPQMMVPPPFPNSLSN